MKIVKKKKPENCHFYSNEKSLYIAWACFRNALKALSVVVLSLGKYLLFYFYSMKE